MNHSNTIEQFFALIRSGLWGGKAASSPFDGGADWEALLRLASMQSLTGIFADGAGTLPRELMPPAETARRLFVTVESIRRANRRLDAVLAELEAGLRREGIEGILLKGQGVARAYLHPELRMCGDIDLYPGKGDAYLRCCEIVRSLGESEGREDESEKHFHFNRRGCSIEIHSHVMLAADPFVNRRLQRWTDEMLDDPSKLRHVEINGVEVNLPPVDFDAVFILQHIANHLLKGGIGLRQLCDWSRYLHVHAAEIDRARLGNNLRTLRLMNCWQLFGWLAVNRLGLPEAEMPFYSPRHEKRALRCLRIILRKGNFGQYDKAARRNLDINFILRKMQTCLIVIGQHAELLRVIPAEVLRHLPWYLLDGIKRLFTGK
ncbi:MAG: nucleotidyltransferase family protein [Candidatus Phocaeicola excrementipullorum]|uniref:Nucleotidyltransferase family protein n=1 Tax=Candidatus Phocaeicola excrementipullorum TaxID=2838731 RepID=A0A948TKZ7_9BACT|nr:nucleotidyltransferase family protein [Candidatus Phocaeicola excrementipullorum]